MDGPVMLGVLGGIVFERDGARIALGGPKAQQLLAVLAANPDRSVPTDRLVDALWPDRPPESHLAVVQSQISRLRAVLGPEIAIRRLVDHRGKPLPDSLDLEYQELKKMKAAEEKPEPKHVP